MNKFTKKKALALLMAFTMVFSIMPFQVIANAMEAPPASTDVQQGYDLYLGKKTVTFTHENFPVEVTVYDGMENLAFYIYVTIFGYEDLVSSEFASELETDTPSEVILWWYQDGARRDDKGYITITQESFEESVKIDLYFAEVSTDDGGNWTLRVYYDTDFIESPQSLTLTVEDEDIYVPVALPLTGATFLAVGTWYETAWAIWQGTSTSQASDFRVYVRAQEAFYWRDDSPILEWDKLYDFVPIDAELIRLIDPARNLFRVDVPGLPMGTYDIKVVSTAEPTEVLFSEMNLVTWAFPRLGAAFIPGDELVSRFAPHHDAPYGATGGYLSDGRVDPNAVIMYVSHGDWDDFTRANLVQNSTFRDGNPLIVRFLGTVGAVGHRENLMNQAIVELPPLLMESPNAGPNDNGRQAQLLDGSHRITFEGIGSDAGIYGWGIITGGGTGSNVNGVANTSSNNIVIRNISIDGYFSFGLRADGTSRNIWMHNNTARYGANWFLFGDGETDRSMGRGVMDAGQHVSGYTFSYNHFEGGRGTHLVVGGVQNFALDDNVHRHVGTMHHNLYDGSQERNPRTRHHNLHLFNNLYLNILGHPLHYRLSDRHTGYGQGAAHNAIIWSEGNIFEDIGFPMQRSRHGHARGYYPHTGHNHFFGDGPGFMVTNENLLLDGGALTSIGSMPFPTFGEWGYRNSVTGLNTPAEFDVFRAAVGQLQPNVMDAATASTFDPTVDTGITVDEEATMMVPPELDPAAVGFPALNAAANTHGWGFQGDFRPHIERDQVMPTGTAEEVAELRSHIMIYAGRMPSLHEILSLEPTIAPANVQINFNEFNFIMHRHNSPMDSLRTVEFPHTFTLEWDGTDTFTKAYEVQFQDNGTWRTLGFVNNDDRPNRFSTDSLHDHGYLQLSGGGHEWVATHWGGRGLSVLYPNTRIGHSSNPLYTEADIPNPENLRWPADWVIADVVNGGLYNFRIRAVNDHGTSDWTNVSHTVGANHPHIQDIVQLTGSTIEPGITVEFEVATGGIVDGTYTIALSVPRSLPRRELPWITRSMRNQIYLYNADLTALPAENTESRAGHGFTQLGNGGRGTIEIVDGVGTITVQLTNDVPEDVFDLVLTIAVDGVNISLPFALFVGIDLLEVENVTITPVTETINRGTTRQFSATVEGTGDFDRSVTWYVNSVNGISISGTGILTVDENVSVGTVLTVRAVSVVNSNVYDEVTITVTAPSATPPPTTPTPPTPPVIPPAPPSGDGTTGDTASSGPWTPGGPVQPQDLELEIETESTPPIQPPTPPVPPTPPTQQFEDVAPEAWYSDYVHIVVDNNLFQGTALGIFSPQLNMTRAMFAQVLANLEGVDLASYSATIPIFADVSSSAWYFVAIQWASDVGIINGVGYGNFAPNDNITREQMAVMLYRFVNIKGIELPQGSVTTFIDQDTISPWAAEAVTAIQRAGMVTGRPDESFDPQATATRAEVATIFARFLQIIQN